MRSTSEQRRTVCKHACVGMEARMVCHSCACVCAAVVPVLLCTQQPLLKVRTTAAASCVSRVESVMLAHSTYHQAHSLSRRQRASAAGEHHPHASRVREGERERERALPTIHSPPSFTSTQLDQPDCLTIQNII